MRPIPNKLREDMAADPFYQKCIYNNSECCGKIEWEHAWLYSGKQINEKWAIIPCCTYHHRGAGLRKWYNEFRALIRADITDLMARMPRRNWHQELKRLTYLNEIENKRKTPKR